jgi:hypothetical protein
MYKSKDEQFSTWMDWIWSSMCLELLCTSTQSSDLKWVSGGGINSPRHQTRCWPTSSCRIDRRCPHSDRRIIRCYCLHCSSSATRLTLLENGSSVHSTVRRVSTNVPTRQTIAPTLAILVLSVYPTVSFPSFSSRLQLGSLLQLNILHILNMPLLIASKYILSPQICCM